MNMIEPSDFAYVPSNGKIPIYAWVEDCPDDVDPRCLENPFAVSYNETQDDRLQDGLIERFPDWEGDWIIIGSAEETDRFVDFDVDLKNHDETLDDPDKVRFQRDVSTVFTSPNGIHVIQFFTELGAMWVDQMDADTPPGLDIQGDSTNKMGVVGSPWHQDKYEIKRLGHKIRTPEDSKTLFSYDDEPILVTSNLKYRSRSSKPFVWEGPIHTSDVFPDLPVEVNRPHPIHGSSGGGNFKIDEEGTFACWSSRHDRWPVVGTPYHAIAMREGILTCGDWDNIGDYGGKRDEIEEYCLENDIELPDHWEKHRIRTDEASTSSLGQMEQALLQ